MKIPNYNLKDSTDNQTSLNLISAAINSKNPNGIDGAYRRTFGRIQIKFEEAKENEIEFEFAELDLMKNALRDGKLPSMVAKYALLLEDALDEAMKK